MRIKKIVNMFEKGNVCVVGLKGTGKDVLFGNVVARRKIPYISNTYYSKGLIPFRYEDLAVAGNNYKAFVNNKLSHYDFPFADGTDVYLADAGVYFPAQYCNELNRDFKEMPTYQALSRHLGESNFHVNVQNLNRVWDKIREQSDTYIMCRKCKFLFGKVVFMKITLYEKYDSCVNRVQPWKVKLPFFASKEMRLSCDIARQQYANAHGRVENRFLLFWNKSKHDTRVFKEMMHNA